MIKAKASNRDLCTPGCTNFTCGKCNHEHLNVPFRRHFLGKQNEIKFDLAKCSNCEEENDLGY